MGLILFRGRIPRLENNREAFVPVCTVFSRSPEINELDFTGAHTNKIGRTDITVDQSGCVYAAQRLHDRAEQTISLIKGDLSVLFNIFLEALALQILHHNIDSLIVFKEIAHAHYVGIFRKPGQYARFLQEFLFSLFKQSSVLASAYLYIQRLLMISAGNPGRVIFLDCNRHVKHRIVGFIRDSKAALADHLEYLVPVCDKRTGRKQIHLIFHHFIEYSVL